MFARLKKVAEIFKPGAYHYALLDYLTDELKTNNIKCRKRTSYISIKLDNVIEDKYDKVVIDCFNGNVYLRGDNTRDRKILRLNRFGGGRESDAMHCAKGGCKQVMRYIEKLTTPKQLEVEAIMETTETHIMTDYRNHNYKDMRKQSIAAKKKVIKDMRKFNYKKIVDLRNFLDDITFKRLAKCNIIKDLRKVSQMHDICNRDSAIAYIDGNVLEGHTHGKIISDYIQTIINKPLNNSHNRSYIYNSDILNPPSHTYGDELDAEVITQNIKQIAFAHKCDDEGIIYIEEDTLQDIDINIVAKAIKESYPEYEIYSDESEKKIAKIKTDLRFIGCRRLGNIASLSRDYALAIVNGRIYTGDTHGQTVTRFLEENEIDLDGMQFYDRYEVKEIFGNNLYSQFAAAHIKENEIYIDQRSFENITLEQVIKILKESYPDYILLDYDTREKVAHLTKIVRLKKLSWHDISNRSCAMTYIDGEVIEEDTHALCVNKYLEEHYDKNLSEQQIRPNINIEVDDAWDDEQAQDLSNIYDNIKQIAFGHIDKINMSIYLEPEGLNITLSDLSNIAKAIKDKYNDYNIYIDNASNEQFEQIANNIKTNGFHDYKNRTSAVMYIDGNILEDNDHHDMITSYMKQKYNLDRNDSEKEVDKLFDTLQYAMGSKVDSENKIYLDTDTFNYIDNNTVINAFKSKYPGFDIEIETSTNQDIKEYNETYFNKLIG